MVSCKACLAGASQQPVRSKYTPCYVQESTASLPPLPLVQAAPEPPPPPEGGHPLQPAAAPVLTGGPLQCLASYCGGWPVQVRAPHDLCRGEVHVGYQVDAL